MINFFSRHYLILQIILPFLGAVISSTTFRISISRFISLLILLANLFLNIFSYSSVYEYSLGGWENYSGINLFTSFGVYNLLTLVNFIFFFSILLSFNYIEKHVVSYYKSHYSHLIYSFLLFLNSAFMGIMVTEDFFTLYVFIEIASLSSYVLMSVGKRKISLVYSLDYLIIGSIGATLILIGIGIIFKLTGTLNIKEASNSLLQSRLLFLGIVFYLIGCLMKIAFFPFHNWMLQAYRSTIAPFLMIIGSLSSVIYIYVLYLFLIFFLSGFKFANFFGDFNILLYFSGIVSILPAIFALRSNNLKEMVLLSSVQYASYFVIMCISNMSYDLISYSLIVVSLIKFSLFYILYLFELYNIRVVFNDNFSIQFSNIWFRIGFILIILASAALPLTGGFSLKILFLKHLAGLKLYFLLLCILISSTISLFYHYKVIKKFFFFVNADININFKVLENFVVFILGILQLFILFVPNNSFYFQLFNLDISNYLVSLIALLFVVLTVFLPFIRSYFLRLLFSSIGFLGFFSLFIYISFQHNFFFLETPIHFFKYSLLDVDLLDLAIDKYSAYFITLLGMLWPISILYSDSYLYSNKYKNVGNFLLFINLSVLSTILLSLSGNLITMFSFYEILSLATIPLIIYKNTNHVYDALKKYLIYLFVPSTLFFLFGIFLVYSITGQLGFDSLSGVFESNDNQSWIVILSFLSFFLGISKAASFPFYSWLPNAMIALHPVSGLLHGVAVINSGIFCFLKIILYIYGLDYTKYIYGLHYIVLIPSIMLLFASFSAMYQKNLKSILAFSTIAQSNLILIGLFSFNKVGIIGGMLHTLLHSFGKLLLFFKVGDLYSATKKNNIEHLCCKFKDFKSTYLLFLFCIFSLSGMPFLLGYFSKNLILLSYSATSFWLVKLVIQLSSIITIIYLYRILFYMSNNNFNQDGSKEWVAKTQSSVGYILLFLILSVSCFYNIRFVGSSWISSINSLLFYVITFVFITYFYSYILLIFNYIKNFTDYYIKQDYYDVVRCRIMGFVSTFNSIVKLSSVFINMTKLNFTLYSFLVLFIVLLSSIN